MGTRRRLLTEAAGRTRVEVEILAHSAPRELLVEGGGRVLQLSASGGDLDVDGSAVDQPLLLPERRWRVLVPGEPRREYAGGLEVRATEGEVRLVLVLPLERYVARVVASETSPGTPFEALRAQAVVVRSFALAARGRHAGGRLCDLAHCQVLRGSGLGPEHVAAAAAAARSTAGEVLRLAWGAVAEAVFHASCGGHTADPLQVFGGEETGAAAVEDPGCRGPEWSARMPVDLYLAVAREKLACPSSGCDPSRRSSPLPALPPGGGGLGRGAPRSAARSAEDVKLLRGAGGWIAQVAAGGARTSGDGFARALDGALGWGKVRSSWFRVAVEGASVRLDGRGLGHGVGLCQAGAALWARRGESYRAILAHYFPRARIGRFTRSARVDDLRPRAGPADRGVRAEADGGARPTSPP